MPGIRWEIEQAEAPSMFSVNHFHCICKVGWDRFIYCSCWDAVNKTTCSEHEQAVRFIHFKSAAKSENKDWRSMLANLLTQCCSEANNILKLCFIRALYDLSENTHTGDRLIAGIHDKELSRWLHTYSPTLAWKLPCKMIRQAKYIAEVKPQSNVWHWNLGKRPLGEKMLLQRKVSVSIGHVSALIQELMLRSWSFRALRPKRKT